MKKSKYLFGFYIVFITMLGVYAYTLIPLFYYLSLPAYIGVGFWFYFREKEKLEIKTTRILTLLKFECTTHWLFVLVLLLFVYISQLSNGISYYPLLYLIVAILLILYLLARYKRSRLTRQLLRKN
ncbi:hypothetical protein HMPREF0432_00696 [Gemella morbillorum M424]|jgi:hypothetical protein|uniref:Uncharacterized protein n=1 Tax=Gemella morbillorum TaxID=29391 RepID=A0AAP9HB43_9BACL|nr:hypothetical protein [Gemella morbillorum]EFV35663.1 hypothetical protein HMPREF0432_00696 [Gemella morbillorum M424]QGS08375.1 hypothetical protein FOC49_00020 [Gemella morbillorum]